MQTRVATSWQRSAGSPDPVLRVLQELEADGQEVSDWEKYAAEEYDILVAEEAANEECNDV